MVWDFTVDRAIVSLYLIISGVAALFAPNYIEEELEKLVCNTRRFKDGREKKHA